MTDQDTQPHSHDPAEGSELSDMQLRVRSIETVLAEKGYLDREAIDGIVEAFETRIGPHNGARGGGPKGKRNGAYRHGLYTKEALEDRRVVNELVRRARKALV